MTTLARFSHSPIAIDGLPIIITGLALSLVFFLGGVFISPQEHPLVKLSLTSLGSLSLLFVLFSIWFFRDPERTPESTDPRSVISSADGTVLKIENVNDPRYGAPSKKISIFMSPLNVHVNRAPVSGVVEKVEYAHGKFFAANLDKASTDNERNLVILKTDKGQRVGFLQIAGFIARRIVCHVHGGETLSVGQRYGMIRFGSRMEIFLPEQSEILVKPGDFIQAGQTVVGKLPENK